MTDKEAAQTNLNGADEFPYDCEFTGKVDWAHRAARGVLYNLSDRRGVGGGLAAIRGDIETANEMTQSLAAIIRESANESGLSATCTSHISDKGFSFTQTLTSTLKTDSKGAPIETQTFQFDVHDEVQEEGRVVVSVGPREGNVDDFVEVTVQVGDFESNGKLRAPMLQLRGPYDGSGLDIYQTDQGFKVFQEGFTEDDDGIVMTTIGGKKRTA